MNKNTVIASERRERGNPRAIKRFSSWIASSRTLLAMTFTLGLILMTVETNANDRVLNITQHTTPAGIKLWHVEDNSLPITTIHFAFRGAGAVNDPANKIGLGQLVSNTIDEGAGERDASAFQEALQDHAIELSFSNNRDHFTGKLKTLKRHQDLAIELLYDALHKPRFDLEAADRMKYANIMRIKSSQSNSDWMVARLANDVYFGAHPYARNSGGTISGLKAITKKDMTDFVKTNFTRQNLVVATAGNLNADEATAIIDKIFADLPLDGREYQLDDVTPPETPIKIAYEMDSPQSAVQMIWPSFPQSDPDYHAMRVMNHILGGGGFSSYLMDEVREKKGLTYGIYSQPVNMDYADYMMIQSATSPENIAPMTQAVSDVLTKLKTQNVDAQLLDDAKSYLIGSLPLRFASTLSLSGTAIRMQLDGRDINALDNWADKISAVTADDVMRVANRIFVSTEPNATIIAGAVPSDLGFKIVETINGIE